MNNNCFIIMPPSDLSGYPDGHVGRVYDYLIAPACRKSGYFPLQPDITATIDTFGVLKETVDSGVAIFDLTGNNINAMYGLAVRHALGLPYILIKDSKSILAFHAPELDVIEYDESLRIDTVQKTTDLLSEALTKAVASQKDKHEMLRHLSFAASSSMPDTPAPAAVEDEPIVPQPPVKKIHIISPLPDYVGEAYDEKEITKLKAGDELFHLSHGRGKVNSIKKMGKDELANIEFESGSKLLVLTASDFYRKIVR